MSTRSVHSEIINPAIACIYDQALTSIVGTGFTLTERHVVTCAHVVNAALGRDHVTTVPPTEQALLTLSFLNSRHTELHRELVAKVVKWIPQERGFFDLDDIAILELIDTPKPLAIPKLVQLTEHDYFSQRPFQAFGFNISEGSWADGRIGGLTATDTIQLNMERPIEEGFSGAPVWDNERRGVTGMLVTMRAELKTAYMIPMSHILAILPEARSNTKPKFFLSVLEKTLKKLKTSTIILKLYIALFVIIVFVFSFSNTTPPDSKTKITINNIDFNEISNKSPKIYMTHILKRKNIAECGQDCDYTDTPNNPNENAELFAAQAIKYKKWLSQKSYNRDKYNILLPRELFDINIGIPHYIDNKKIFWDFEKNKIYDKGIVRDLEEDQKNTKEQAYLILFLVEKS